LEIWIIGASSASFTPDPQAGLVANDSDPTRIRINRVPPPSGDLGALRIGRLVIDTLSNGVVFIDAKSHWVDSSLDLQSFETTVIAASGPDQDGDGFPDSHDACVAISDNGCDTDRDGYGNVCDGDFDQDYFVYPGDFTIWYADFQTGYDISGT